jgi:WD40 repeat protein
VNQFSNKQAGMHMIRKTPFWLLSSMFVLMVLFVGCCADTGSMAVTNTPMVSPAPSQTPAPTEIPISVEGFVPIDKDNFRNIELIAELGAGKLYDTVVSQDGLTFATVTASGVTLYDMETFEEIHHQEHYIYPAAPFTFSPDGKYLVYTDHVKVNQINIESWEMETLFYIPGQKSQIEELIFTPKGNRIFVVNQYGSYKCDGLEVNYSLFTLDGNLLFSRNVCGAYFRSLHQFNIDDTTSLEFINMMSAAYPYELYRIDNETGNVLAASYKRQIEYGGEVVETIIGDEQFLPSGDELPKIAEELYSPGSNDFLLHCGISIDKGYGNQLIYNDDSFAILNPIPSNAIVKINIETCDIMQELQISSANELSFSAMEELAFTANEFSTYVWQTINGNQVFTEEGIFFDYPNNLASFNQDGTYFLSAPYNSPYFNTPPDYNQNAVTVRNVENFEIVSIIDFPGKGLYAFYKTPFPNIMIIKDSSGSKLWNIETGEMVSKLPNGQYISDEVNQQLWVIQKISDYLYAPSIYDAQSGELIRGFSHLRGKIFAASLSEDASFLDLQYQNDEGYVFSSIDTDTGEEIWNEIIEFETNSNWDYDHPLSKWSLGYSFVDRPILIVREDGLSSTKMLDVDGPLIVSDDLQFWDLENGIYLGKLYPRYDVDRVIFSPHDYFMALLGDDGIARIFGVRDE